MSDMDRQANKAPKSKDRRSGQGWGILSNGTLGNNHRGGENVRREKDKRDVWSGTGPK